MRATRFADLPRACQPLPTFGATDMLVVLHRCSVSLTSDLILWMQWDHIYSANYFLSLLGLLAASLAACSTTRCLLTWKAVMSRHVSPTCTHEAINRRQLPSVRVARRWQFQKRPERIWKQGSAAVLPGASAKELGPAPERKGVSGEAGWSPTPLYCSAPGVLSGDVHPGTCRCSLMPTVQCTLSRAWQDG